jgi:hypothetical protein
MGFMVTVRSPVEASRATATWRSGVAPAIETPGVCTANVQ